MLSATSLMHWLRSGPEGNRVGWGRRRNTPHQRATCTPRLETLEGRLVLSHRLLHFSITDLGTLGGTFSEAFGINNRGDVVGGSFIRTGDTAEHAFLFSKGKMTDLGTLGGTSSVARGINNRGDVVGESTIAGDTAFHAFLFSKGTRTDLGTLGGTFSLATGINNRGDVIGGPLILVETASHAFLFSHGTGTDLGTLGGTSSVARGINNRGDVVGDSETTDGATHAFLFSKGTMTDLNDLIPAVSGITLVAANGISDNGQIAASGRTPGGEVHAVLLTPGGGDPASMNSTAGTASSGAASHDAASLTIPASKAAWVVPLTGAEYAADASGTVIAAAGYSGHVKKTATA